MMKMAYVQENVLETLLLLSHLFTAAEVLENNHGNSDRVNVLKEDNMLNEDAKLCFFSLISNNGSESINFIHFNLIEPLSLLRENC